MKPLPPNKLQRRQETVESGGIKVDTGVGAYIRELRTVRRLSMSRLAERAQLAKGTLSYWESGRFQPRVPELEAALKALNVTSAERLQAMALLDAPRAIRRHRAEERRAAVDDEEAGAMPAIGDLLRAMRRRAGQSPEQLAATLRVHPGTVRRWEKSEVIVPEERLDDLCRALSAAPEERMALARRRLRLWAPGQDSSITPEAAYEQCELLLDEAERGETTLMDLRLLLMEARLRPQVSDSSRARRSLARVFTAHARYLEMSGRGLEVMPYATRALDLMVGHFLPEPWWTSAVHAVGFVLAPHLGERRHRRRIEYIGQWLNFTDDPFWLTNLYRDMAQYSAEGGDYNAALEYSIGAVTAAERLGDETTLRLAFHIQTMVLLNLERYADALPLLPRDNHPNIHQRIFEESHWVQTFTGLQEWDVAHDRLNGLYALVYEYGLSTEGPDNLARQLDRSWL